MKFYLQTRPIPQIRILLLEADTLLAKFNLDVFSPTYITMDVIFASKTAKFFK